MRRSTIFGGSMGSVTLVARAELRRWPQLLQLALLVAFVSAAVAAALVGAHRTSTAAERLRTASDASDALYQSEGRFHADGLERAARGLDGVEGVAQRHLVNAFLPDGAISDIAIMSDPADRYAREIDRPRVLEGRMPEPDAPTEILLNELAAASTGLGVGDRIEALTWSESDLETLFTSTSFPGFNGPRLDLVVVGIGRTLDELPGDLQRTTPYAIASAAFLGANPGIGAWPPAVLVRVRGDDRLADVTEALGVVPVGVDGELGPGGHYAPASTARTIYLDTVQRTATSLALGLVVFAVAALLVGALVLGQAVVRHRAASAAPALTLRQLGESRRGIALGGALPIAAAAAVGALAGMVLAVAASPLLPLGLMRRVEPDPGVMVDPWVAGGTVAGVAVAVSALGVVLGTREPLRGRGRTQPTSAPAAVGAARTAGATPAVVAGVRLAVDRGTPPLPNRTTLVALGVAVAGIVGAAVIGASDSRLDAEPARWGWNWSTMPDTFDPAVDVGEATSRLALDDRLAGVGSYSSGSVSLDGRAVTAHAMTGLAGDVGFTRRSGRLPSGPGEVALGAGTMRDLGVTIGDTVSTVDATTGAEPTLTVVGTVVLPYDENQTLDDGAVLTPDTFDRLVLDDPLSTLVLVYPAGVDDAALEADLTADYGFTFTAFSRPREPGAVANLSVVAQVSAALATFFAALAAISTTHTLSVAGRRRRHELAILRAVGFTSAGVRVAVLCQGLVLGVVALVVGVPAGLVIGRLVWLLVSADVGALAPPAVPLGVVLTVVPATLGIIGLLAWWPGRSAARRPPAADLRTE